MVPATSSNAKTILLVEDNPDDEVLTLRALSKNNLLNEVVVARDGAEALDYLFAEGNYADRDATQIPSLVLLDIQLPKIDGFGVLKRLRAAEHTRFLPVVILTSSAEQEDILSGYGLGANSYIRKPVDFDEFFETVGQLGPYWLLLNQQPDPV
jgi:two-component system response regulator